MTPCRAPPCRRRSAARHPVPVPGTALWTRPGPENPVPPARRRRGIPLAVLGHQKDFDGDAKVDHGRVRPRVHTEACDARNGPSGHNGHPKGGGTMAEKRSAAGRTHLRAPAWRRSAMASRHRHHAAGPGDRDPRGSEHDLIGALVEQWPSYLAYLVSFATIGAVWLKHSVVTEYLDHATSVFIRLNLLLLLVVSFLPFPDPTGRRAHQYRRSRTSRDHRLRHQLDACLAPRRRLMAIRHPPAPAPARCPGGGARPRRQGPHHEPGRLRRHDRALLFLPVVAVLGYLAIAVYILVPVGAFRHHKTTRT